MSFTWRKKPVIIEAVQVKTDNPLLDQFVAKHQPPLKLVVSEDRIVEWTVASKEGVMKAPAGAWLIRGVAGEFYPCDHEIFLKTYDKVVTHGG